MPKDTLIRKRPMFPIQYGMSIENIMQYFDGLAEKGLKITQMDVLKLLSKLSNLEAFVRPLIIRNEDYEGEKADIEKAFGQQRTLYGQIDVLRRWFGLINTVVDQMYFDIAGIERYEPYTGTHQGKS